MNLESWSRARIMCAQVVFSTAAEVCVAVLVAINVVIVCIEADNIEDPLPWIKVINAVLIMAFATELAARIFVQRAQFFCEAMNLLDLFTVMLDTTATILEMAVSNSSLPSLMMLRMFVLLRLTRSVKVMVKFPLLSLMVKGLANAFSAVVYGVILLCLTLVFWSVTAVHFIHPVNMRVSGAGKYSGCERCERAFASVSQSMLTFTQQIIAGDSWGMVTIPVVEEEPWTVLFFAAVFITMSLTITNVILAVIVETAMETRKEDVGHVVREKQDAFHVAQRRLRKICLDMDADGSGELTVEELKDGFYDNVDFNKMMLAMDFRIEDMDVVFSIIDADKSGTVEVDEFIAELFRIKSCDSHTMLVLIKHFVTEIRRDVREQIHVFKSDVLAHVAGGTGRFQPAVDACEAPAGVCDRSASSSHNGAGRVQAAECAGAGAPPRELPGSSAGAPLEEKRRGPEPALAVEAGSTESLREELRELRVAIGEHLARSMQQLSERSESQTRLLATVAEHTSRLCGGGAPREGGAPPLFGGGLGGCEASPALWPPKQPCCAAAAGPVPGRGDLPPCAAAGGPALGHRELLLGAPAAPAAQAPSSAWGLQTCCRGAPQRAHTVKLQMAAP